jgi:hypothetical protein
MSEEKRFKYFVGLVDAGKYGCESGPHDVVLASAYDAKCAEVERLEARVYDQSTPEAVIRCRNAELLDERQKHLDTIATLRDQLQAAQRNEARYLWLRNRECPFGTFSDSGDPFWEEGLDIAIDAAMGEK